MCENIDWNVGRVLAKLVESPFYAAGGGQISDAGTIACEDGDCLVRPDFVARHRALARTRHRSSSGPRHGTWF